MEEACLHEGSTGERGDDEAAVARQGQEILDYGCPRCDEDVWQAMDPSTTKASKFKPGWVEADEEMLKAYAYYDQWREKYGGW